MASYEPCIIARNGMCTRWGHNHGRPATDSTPTVREVGRYGFLSSDGYPEEGPNPLITPTVSEAGDEGIAAVLRGAGFWGTHADRWNDTKWQDEFWATLAAALAPLIAEREAKAWDEGWHSSWAHWVHGRDAVPNPYRAALAPETPEAGGAR